MFLFRKKRRKKINDKNQIYYIISVLFITAGAVSGYVNNGQDVVLNFTDRLSGASVFHFSFIKNLVFLILIFINSFSLLGIPVCASILVLNGYMLAVSVNTLYISATSGKLVFLLTNLPHLAFSISANVLLAEVAFRFSKIMLSCVLRNGNRVTLNKVFKELTYKFVISVCFILLSAIYEGYVM